MAELETRHVRFPAQSFIDDPGLFARVEELHRKQEWFALFGEWPIGAVLATVEDGIIFHYKADPAGPHGTPSG